MLHALFAKDLRRLKTEISINKKREKITPRLEKSRGVLNFEAFYIALLGFLRTLLSKGGKIKLREKNRCKNYSAANIFAQSHLLAEDN